MHLESSLAYCVSQILASLTSRFSGQSNASPSIALQALISGFPFQVLALLLKPCENTGLSRASMSTRRQLFDQTVCLISSTLLSPHLPLWSPSRSDQSAATAVLDNYLAALVPAVAEHIVPTILRVLVDNPQAGADAVDRTLLFAETLASDRVRLLGICTEPSETGNGRWHAALCVVEASFIDRLLVGDCHAVDVVQQHTVFLIAKFLPFLARIHPLSEIRFAFLTVLFLLSRHDMDHALCHGFTHFIW